MYWQVYLHKTSLAAERMLIKFFERVRDLHQQGENLNLPENLLFFLKNSIGQAELKNSPKEILNHFSKLDDIDIWTSIKKCSGNQDFILDYLSSCLLERKLFKIIFSDTPFERDFIEETRQKIVAHLNVDKKHSKYLLIQGKESNQAYTTRKDEIIILNKNGSISSISNMAEKFINTNLIIKFFLCYPRY